MSGPQNPFLLAAERAASGVAEPLNLRMALSGPPGCGKTYSALAVARALVGQDALVALIDTERGSSRRYLRPRGPFTFAPVDLEDYHPRRYMDLLRGAADAGAAAVVVDSLTHAWDGKGGVLELVDAQGGDGRKAWAKIKPLERDLIAMLLDFPGHVFVTLRTKNAYEEVENERTGRKQQKKVGLAAVQREGIEFEFDVVLRLQGGRAYVEKTRCPALDDQTFDRPGENVAKLLRPWLAGGVRGDQAPAKPSAPDPAPIGPRTALAQKVRDLQSRLTSGVTRAKVDALLDKAVDVAQLEKLVDWTEKQVHDETAMRAEAEAERADPQPPPETRTGATATAATTPAGSGTPTPAAPTDSALPRPQKVPS